MAGTHAAIAAAINSAVEAPAHATPAPTARQVAAAAAAHAKSGRKAWQLLQREPVSAIITDLHMPHMDGFELIERVRAAAPVSYVPIIVVSGDSDPDTPGKVRQLGADAYFAKPYSPAAVRDTLERLLHENSPPSS